MASHGSTADAFSSLRCRRRCSTPTPVLAAEGLCSVAACQFHCKDVWCSCLFWNLVFNFLHLMNSFRFYSRCRAFWSKKNRHLLGSTLCDSVCVHNLRATRHTAPDPLTRGRGVRQVRVSIGCTRMHVSGNEAREGENDKRQVALTVTAWKGGDGDLRRESGIHFPIPDPKGTVILL